MVASTQSNRSRLREKPPSVGVCTQQSQQLAYGQTLLRLVVYRMLYAWGRGRAPHGRGMHHVRRAVAADRGPDERHCGPVASRAHLFENFFHYPMSPFLGQRRQHRRPCRGHRPYHPRWSDRESPLLRQCQEWVIRARVAAQGATLRHTSRAAPCAHAAVVRLFLGHVISASAWRRS